MGIGSSDGAFAGSAPAELATADVGRGATAPPPPPIEHEVVAVRGLTVSRLLLPRLLPLQEMSADTDAE